jgi:hypothetical protein
MPLVTAMVLMGAAHRASADMVPVDPYADHQPGEPTTPGFSMTPTLSMTPAFPMTHAFSMTPAPATAFAVSAATAAALATASGSVTDLAAPPVASYDTSHGATLDDVLNTLVTATTQHPDPSISLWKTHRGKLMVSGFVLSVFAWFVWRRRARTQQRAATMKRQTQFQMSAIDPSVADNHVAAWERGLTSHPVQPAATSHTYGPYGRVTPTQKPIAMPFTSLTGNPATYVPAPAPAAQAYGTPATIAQPYAAPAPVAQPYAAPATIAQPYAAPVSVAQPYAAHAPIAQPYAAHAQPYAAPVPAARPYAAPVPVAQPYAAPTPVAQPYLPSIARVASAPVPVRRPGQSLDWALAVLDQDSKSVRDPGYQAHVDREPAVKLARGSQPDELEKTRSWLAMQSNPSPPEPPAVRATRLRHPHVPKPAYIAMLSHMPNRLS